MKILHLVTFVDAARSYGGPLSVALGLAEEQAKQNHEVTVVGLTNDQSQNSRPAGNALTEKLFTVRRFTPGQKFSKLFSLRAAIWVWKNQNKFDVIHMHFSRDVFQTVIGVGLGVKKFKLVLQPHGMLTNLVADKKLVQSIYDRLLTNRVVQKASLILALQETEKAALIRGFKPKSIELLPNGVTFSGKAQPLMHDPKLIVFVSRLHVQKNPMLFVEAALKIIETRSDYQFAIAGPDGGQGAMVRQAIERARTNQLRYLGALQNQEVRDLFGKAGLLVLPSIDDQFPMVVLEALSSGLQVTVSKSCGLSELIESNELGEVFDLGLDELVTSILKATSSPTHPEIIASKARQLFDISLIVEKLDVVYRHTSSDPGGKRK
jgi:glycosyltransferase involved in cell wall biosynthesis